MVIVIGLIGDTFTLRTAFYISAGLMLVGSPLPFLLPKRKGKDIV
jgi:hypothetical protein